MWSILSVPLVILFANLVNATKFQDENIANRNLMFTANNELVMNELEKDLKNMSPSMSVNDFLEQAFYLGPASIALPNGFPYRLIQINTTEDTAVFDLVNVSGAPVGEIKCSYAGGFPDFNPEDIPFRRLSGVYEVFKVYNDNKDDRTLRKVWHEEEPSRSIVLAAKNHEMKAMEEHFNDHPNLNSFLHLILEHGIPAIQFPADFKYTFEPFPKPVDNLPDAYCYRVLQGNNHVADLIHQVRKDEILPAAKISYEHVINPPKRLAYHIKRGKATTKHLPEDIVERVYTLPNASTELKLNISLVDYKWLNDELKQMTPPMSLDNFLFYALVHGPSAIRLPRTCKFRIVHTKSAKKDHFFTIYETGFSLPFGTITLLKTSALPYNRIDYQDIPAFEKPFIPIPWIIRAQAAKNGLPALPAFFPFDHKIMNGPKEQYQLDETSSSNYDFLLFHHTEFPDQDIMLVGRKGEFSNMFRSYGDLYLGDYLRGDLELGSEWRSLADNSSFMIAAFMDPIDETPVACMFHRKNLVDMSALSLEDEEEDDRTPTRSDSHQAARFFSEDRSYSIDIETAKPVETVEESPLATDGPVKTESDRSGASVISFSSTVVLVLAACMLI